MHVYKFGGSCLTGPESFATVARILADAGPPAVCIFSALKGTTDRLLVLAAAAERGAADAGPLLEAHHLCLERLAPASRARAAAALDELGRELERTLTGIAYLREASPRILDRVVSFGERAAVALAEAMLTDAGLPVRLAQDGDPGFLSDGVHGDARILPGSEARVRERFTERGAVYVVPGFLARSREGELTTLGRGGSDYSATYIGAALGAPTTLWKDTDGLLSADPRVVPGARLLARVHYLDALELAHYGTEAIADKAILPAMAAGTAIEIRSLGRPEVRTRIDGAPADALAVTCVRRAVMVDFLGLRRGMLRTLARLFDALADMRTWPLLMTEASPRGETSMVLKEADLPRLERYLREHDELEQPEIRRELGVVSIIGSHMRGRVGMAAGIFEALAEREVNIVAIAQTASERNVSVTVDRPRVEDGVRALHDRFLGGAQGGGAQQDGAAQPRA